MDPTWTLVAALTAGILAVLMALVWALSRGSRASRRRVRRAQRGEMGAERLLERAGYRIDERQVTQRWTIEVDGEPEEVESRADLLVTRRDRRYVAEVKTGDLAPDPTYPPTRRQLLEYSRVFDVDGVLLVDMEAEEVMEVEFPEM